MEFEDEHDEEEEDEGPEELTIPAPLPPSAQLTPPSYDSSGRAIHFPRVNSDRLVRSSSTVSTRYRECLKNHAVSIGSHALDGCGEFMPAGDDGTLNALKCAACNCHRNFHRKETTTTTTTPGTFFYRTPEGYFHAPNRQVGAHTSTSPGTHSGEIDDSGGGNMTATMRKRFRTRFSQEQKDKLLGFAEKIGWRIQKEDEEAVKEFCDEIQIKRKVFKVWMHNNKNTLGKKP